MLVSLLAIGFWRTVPADPGIVTIADVSDVFLPTEFGVPGFVGVLIIIVVCAMCIYRTMGQYGTATVFLFVTE